MPVNTDLDELIGKPPHLLVRWGTTVFMLILIIVLLIAWLVPYPETRTVDVRVRGAQVVAKIPEKDITLIKPGQQAIIKFTAFTNTIIGEVSSVSDSGFVATFNLPTAPYKENYTGTAKIIIRKGSFLSKMLKQ